MITVYQQAKKNQKQTDMEIFVLKQRLNYYMKLRITVTGIVSKQ